MSKMGIILKRKKRADEDYYREAEEYFPSSPFGAAYSEECPSYCGGIFLCDLGLCKEISEEAIKEQLEYLYYIGYTQVFVSLLKNEQKVWIDLLPKFGFHITGEGRNYRTKRHIVFMMLDFKDCK